MKNNICVGYLYIYILFKTHVHTVLDAVGLQEM